MDLHLWMDTLDESKVKNLVKFPLIVLTLPNIPPSKRSQNTIISYITFMGEVNCGTHGPSLIIYVNSSDIVGWHDEAKFD